MRSTKLFLSLLLGFALTVGFSPVNTGKTEYVYLCEGHYSKVYHRSPDCRGLSNCSTRIEKVTLEEAQHLGRRPCKIEYK